MDSIVFFKDRRFYEVDPRIKFLVGFIGSLFMLFIDNELALSMTFILGIVWCVYCGKWKNAIGISIIYGLLYWWTIVLANAPDAQGNGFIIITILFRRFMLIGAFVTPLACVEVGLLVASLKKMKLPKMVVMSIAILFRFFPTIQHEYRSVRTSQKFRAIGRTIFNVIGHPITFYETLAVPLAIRIMRISDELSASAILRGADLKGNNCSFRDIRITILDCLIFVLFIVCLVFVLFVNYGYIFNGVIL